MAKVFRGLTVAVPVVAGLVLGSGGCSAAKDAAGGGLCEAGITARVEALQGSVDALVSLAGSLKLDVATACKNIAEAGGETAMVSAAPTDAEVTEACNAASAAIEAQFMAAGSCTMSFAAPECTVDASAQVSCEGDCKVDATCTEPELDVRCTGGELSVSCMGTCMAGATCEGSATVEAECEGTCSATCTGTCSGKCTGECMGTCSAMNGDGSCAGTCDGECKGNCDAECGGTCNGKCELKAGAMVTCTAEARCEGECMGTASAPTCSGTIAPPMCEANAECQASCEGDAKFEAKCSPASIELACMGSIDASFLAAFKTNMGVIVSLGAKAELAAEAAGNIVGDFTALIESSGACALSLAGELQASVEASASVSVSVSASASASGSAGSS